MIHSFGDPNDLFSTIKDFSKKTKRKTSKTASSDDKNSEVRESNKSLDDSEILEAVSIGQEVNGDKPKVQEKEEKKHSGYERKSFKTLRFRIKNRKKSKSEEEIGKSYDDGKEERGCPDQEKVVARGSSSSSDQERISSSAAGELALKILQEINGTGIMRGFDGQEINGTGIMRGFDGSEINSINDQEEFKGSEILPNHEDTNEGVLLRRSIAPFEGSHETKRQETRSGNFSGLPSATTNSTSENSPNSPNDSSITWPTLNQEPLYQLYSLDAESVKKNPDSVGHHSTNSKRPSAIEIVSINRRNFWRDIQEVIESNYSEQLSSDERNLQEAKFEILISEASYLKSLRILEKHYIKNILLLGLRLKHLLSEGDLKMLFGNVVEVRKCSENFLKDLEDHWQDDIFLTKITDILKDHANENFEIYKSYSKKYLDMTHKYSDLIAQKAEFKDLLEKLRQSPPAENLPMDSFFALPIQRIARYHMLVENVLKFMKKDCEEYGGIFTLWENLKELAKQCDAEVQKRKRTEEMVRLIRQLEYAPGVENIPILKSNRYLDLQTHIQKIEFREKFDRQHISIKKINLQLLLFNDLLVVVKKSLDKSTPENWVVIDFCPRHFVKVKPMKNLDLFKITELTEAKPVILSLQSNHKSELSEMIISFDKSSDREQWLKIFNSEPVAKFADSKKFPSESENFQVLVMEEYSALTPEELSLAAGEIIDVSEKRVDTWYLGEKRNGREKGWFPAECAVEITPGSVKHLSKEIRTSDEKYVVVLEGFYTQRESYA